MVLCVCVVELNITTPLLFCVCDPRGQHARETDATKEAAIAMLAAAGA